MQSKSLQFCTVSESENAAYSVTHCNAYSALHWCVPACTLYSVLYWYVQGVSKKRYFSDFCLISVLEVGFCFFTRVLESEF